MSLADQAGDGGGTDGTANAAQRSIRDTARVTVEVAVVTTTGLGAEARAVQFVVERYDTEGDGWIYVGDGVDQRVEISLESARRLVRVLGPLIDP